MDALKLQAFTSDKLSFSNYMKKAPNFVQPFITAVNVEVDCHKFQLV